MSNKDDKGVCKVFHLRNIDSRRFVASSLDKLTSNLSGTSEIQCDECGDDMELINISDKYTALLRCERCNKKD